MALQEIWESVIDAEYSEILAPWSFHSNALGCNVTVPAGFIYDHESIPLFKGTSKRGGLVHDYLSRIDSKPVCTKKGAARAYKEVMTIQKNEAWRIFRNYWIVRFWPGYFHKYSIKATYEKISGRSRK